MYEAFSTVSFAMYSGSSTRSRSSINSLIVDKLLRCDHGRPQPEAKPLSCERTDGCRPGTFQLTFHGTVCKRQKVSSPDDSVWSLITEFQSTPPCPTP